MDRTSYGNTLTKPNDLTKIHHISLIDSITTSTSSSALNSIVGVYKIDSNESIFNHMQKYPTIKHIYM